MSKLADLCRIDTLENDVVCVAGLDTYFDFSDSGSFAIDDEWSSRLECWVTLESLLATGKAEDAAEGGNKTYIRSLRVSQNSL